MKAKKKIILGATMSLLAGIVFCASTGNVKSLAENPVKSANSTVSTQNLFEYDNEIDSSYVTSATSTDSCLTYNFSIKFKSNVKTTTHSYMLGFYGEGDEYLPLTVKYDVTTSSGKVSRESYFDRPTTVTNYYGFGSNLGSTDRTLRITLNVRSTEQIDKDSVKLSNIFLAEKLSENSSWTPNLNTNFYLGIKAPANYTGDAIPDPVDSSKMFKVEFEKYGTFAGQTSLIYNIEVDALSHYKTAKASYYSRLSSKLSNGDKEVSSPTLFIRYQLYALSNTSFVITFDDGTVRTYSANNVKPNINLSAGKNTVNFLLGDLKPNHIKSIDIKNLTFYIDIATIDYLKTQPGTAISYAFGNIEVDLTDSKTSNINTYLIISTVIFVVVFAGAAIGLYFYRRNKYKNDEFNRMNTKRYIKSSVTAFIGTGSIYYLILFIFHRSNSLSNTTIVSNPCDVPIVIFGILSIIMIGYYARFFLITYKDHKTKKQIEKLKLNSVDDKQDDGTN